MAPRYGLRDLIEMSCFDSTLNSQFLLYTHTRLNPHCNITMKPNVIYQALTMDRAHSTGFYNTGGLREKLLQIPSLWYFEGQRMDLAEGQVLRMVIIFQYYLFLFRYGLFQYCVRHAQISSIHDLVKGMRTARDGGGGEKTIKSFLPCSYHLSAPCRYHKQLFQISKQYQNTASTLYNAEIQIILRIVTSRITAHPLWIIPMVMPWTLPILRGIMSQLQRNIWAGGQNRKEKIHELVNNVVLLGFPVESVSHTMCLIYNTLNSYLNWTLFCLQQVVVEGPADPRPIPEDLDPDLRCSLCLRSMVVRACTLTADAQQRQNKRKHTGVGGQPANKRKKKLKNIELLYCLDDFSYLTNCCYTYARRVPLAINGVRVVVYTAVKTRYGVCGCGTMCVEDPIKNTELKCDACHFTSS
ncbi:ORF85 [Ranid herpesvirus 2]|uniref:ORF85 n=1 Tax=Ranid herpesvirus 2 TaxID=389214 RepID=Q14W21_9VIRU|nr:ORF85 [Ranid herpesvirus 2]ABG25614.1 ORF85 [Ranid herpesvirus 2]